MNDYDAKRYAMLQFGMHPSATKFIFHFRPAYCGYIVYVFDRKKYPNDFPDVVIEFLSRISLTHTIVDVVHETDGIINFTDIGMRKRMQSSEFNIWTKPSFDGNIDCEMIESVLKNIRGNDKIRDN